MYKIALLLFLTLSYIHCATENSKSSHVPDPKARVKRNSPGLEWSTVSQIFNIVYNEEPNLNLGSILNIATPLIEAQLVKANLSSQCLKDSRIFLSGLKAMELWALRIVDASAKSVDGIMTGSLSSLGSYEECVNTVATNPEPLHQKPVFVGQYCNVIVNSDFSHYLLNHGELPNVGNYMSRMHLRLGICTPSGCTAEDIKHLITSTLTINANVSRCETKEKKQISALDYFVIFWFVFLFLLVIVGSFIEVYPNYREGAANGKSTQFLLAFSLIRNYKKLVNTEVSSDTFTCLYGIRFITISWVVLAHTYFLPNFEIVHGLNVIINMASDVSSQVIVNGSLSVDTFFFMSGMLVCFLIIKRVKFQCHSFNVMHFLLHRLWRLLPLYIHVIMLTFIVHLFGSGPEWHEAMPYFDTCKRNWWRNFLFINNVCSYENMCLRFTWFIAADFQLYVASIIVLRFLLKSWKAGLSLIACIIVASVIYSGVITYMKDFPVLFLPFSDEEQLKRFMTEFYFTPFPHAGPYFVGVLVGYLLATKSEVKIPAAFRALGWSLAFFIGILALFSSVWWTQEALPPLYITALYASLFRVTWTMAIGWMIFCCISGNGGVINIILSWEVFIPLSRLVYAVFYLHVFVQHIFMGNVSTLIQPDTFFMFWIYFGCMCVTLPAAFVFTMLVEAPFLSLEKLMFGERKKNMEEAKSSLNYIKVS